MFKCLNSSMNEQSKVNEVTTNTILHLGWIQVDLEESLKDTGKITSVLCMLKC